MINALDVQYETLKQKIAKECETGICPNNNAGKHYVVKSDSPVMDDNIILIMTLNQGHIAQWGTYVVNCPAKTVVFTPTKSTYWDEVIWKIKGWVPPDWNTYDGADKIPGYASSYIGYVNAHTPLGWLGLYPTYQQFYFEVNWNDGKLIKKTW